MLQRYDIVLVPFPFTDGPSAKPRSALVVALGERHGDGLLAFISSRLVGPRASVIELISTSATCRALAMTDLNLPRRSLVQHPDTEAGSGGWILC